MSSPPSEDDMLDAAPDDDLFGSDDGEEDTKVRELSDRELDSGDDEGRSDRAPDKGDAEEVDYDTGREARVLDSDLQRHALPKPIGGEFNNLRLPKFLGIEPKAFDPDQFQLPEHDHHLQVKSATFSASATANSTIRYRKNQSTGLLESNTVIYRWSDGSTTISVGEEHYEMQTKPLAPPRDSKTYQEVQDSHLYVASPSIGSQLLVMVGHMANQYTVRPNKNIEDDALEKLQKSLAAAARGSHKAEDKNGPQVIANTQDPELQKKRAEIAEKERMKLQRRRETAAEKALLPTGARRRDGGLSVDDLEGGRGRRAPGSGRKPTGKRPRRKADYDSDDDDEPRGRNREDEYDKEDDFLVDSDEEEEIVLDDDDDDGIESEVEEPRRKKQKKRVRDEALSDADADAEADLDDEEAPPAANEPRGRKGRNIIEEDDDE